MDPGIPGARLTRQRSGVGHRPGDDRARSVSRQRDRSGGRRISHGHHDDTRPSDPFDARNAAGAIKLEPVPTGRLLLPATRIPTEIFIDGKPAQRTGSGIDIPAGPHEIRATNDDRFVDVSVTLDVPRGGTATPHTRHAGVLRISSSRRFPELSRRAEARRLRMAAGRRDTPPLRCGGRALRPSHRIAGFGRVSRSGTSSWRRGPTPPFAFRSVGPAREASPGRRRARRRVLVSRPSPWRRKPRTPRRPNGNTASPSVWEPTDRRMRRRRSRRRWRLAPHGPLADDALVDLARLAGSPDWPEELGALDVARAASAKSTPLRRC